MLTVQQTGLDLLQTEKKQKNRLHLDRLISFIHLCCNLSTFLTRPEAEITRVFLIKDAAM